MPLVSLCPDEIRKLRFSFNRWGASPRWPIGHRLSTSFFQQALTDFTFWYFFSGRGELLDHTTGKRFPLKPGVCLCMLPGMDLYIDQDDAAPLGDSFLHFDIYLDERKLHPAAWPYAPFYSEISEIGTMDQSVRRILELLNLRYVNAQFSAESNLQAEFLLKSLLMKISSPGLTHSRDAIESHQEKIVSTLLAQLYSAPERFHNVADLTRASGYGASHFRSLCLQFAGRSPKELLTQAKVEKAKDYLRHTEFTISAIAEILGYKSLFHFSRHFGRATGHSPSAYRRARDT